MAGAQVVRHLALNVFRESVRDRVPFTLVLFAIILIGASLLIGQLTAGQDVKISKDLGLAAIALFGLFIAVFIGVGLVSKEVERRSIYAILAKPVTRPQFIAGKYAGLALTLAVHVLAMSAAYYAVLAWMWWVSPPAVRLSWDAPALDLRLLVAILLTYAELLLVTALALFFSTFCGPLMSAASTIGFYVAGHFNRDLRDFETVVDSRAGVWAARALYHVLPDFSSFDVRTQVVHGLPVPSAYVATTAGYAAAYAAALLLAAGY